MLTQKKSIVWLPGAALFMLLMIYIFQLNVILFYRINYTSLHFGVVWTWITLFGDGLLVAILLIPFLRRHYRTVWAMLWAAIIFNIILHSLKSGLNVSRPPHVLPTDTFYIIGPELHHRAFPSGHTAAAFALAGVVAFGVKSTWKQVVLFCAALLVGLSRIAVGVHWPSDVLAGLIIGWGSAWIGWIVADKIHIGSGFVFQLFIGLLLIAAAAVWLLDYNTHYPQSDWLRYGLGIILLVWGIVDYGLILRDKWFKR